ncbi:MAG: magnesium transporter CorA family protein [Myxococcales bacterium]|nr:magnesium transporter CorA family protein [Myxococcales bacterium]MCB9575956.1 magnesium transporter CorA family protein [Polyangiaceae bacterium]
MKEGSREIRPRGVGVRARALDFATKDEVEIDANEARDAMASGKFVWLDVDLGNADGAREALEGLGLVDDEIIEDALTREPATQQARYSEYLHMVVSGCRLVGRHFDLDRVDAVLGERFLLTIHQGNVLFLSALEKDYKDDFQQFAQSPSFLLYELWEHLIDNYLDVQKRFEERVEELQRDLIGEVDDRVFGRVSELGADLLHFRKVVLPARAVLTDLSTRKSRFISEATQPYLANMVGTIERVLQDLLVDRDILSNSLNLYMSLVGHRTNEVMKKLTVVSVIFLPLTFLCGVYGMNFKVLPELEWNYGYLAFWLVVLAIVVTIAIISRRAKLL